MAENDNKSPNKVKNKKENNCKIKKKPHAWITVVGAILTVAILAIGIPFIINELYKTGKEYITLWGAEDMLSYYGTLLGAAATVLAVIMTIRFTKKQMRRETYLEKENEKWARIETSFADVLNQLNPIAPLQGVMDTGFTAPDKAINILQKYQMTCRTVRDRLCASLCAVDYPKVKGLIESIHAVAELFFTLCEKEIAQYGFLQKLTLKNSAIKILELAEQQPGSLTEEELSEYQCMVNAAEGIRFENIEKAIHETNGEWIKRYKTVYWNLLEQKVSTFDHIYTEIQKNADEMLRLRRKP